MESALEMPNSPETLEQRVQRMQDELNRLRGEVDAERRKKMAAIVCFSGEWDRLFAAFTIANGVLASGYEVDMFFTFWGATAMRDPKGYNGANKTWMQKLLARMLPNGIEKTPLSKMHFGGMGKVMMGKLMKEKGIDDLGTLLDQARELGVRFHLCDTSLSLFGWEKEELIDAERSDWCGVATFLSLAEKSRIVLFI